MRTLKVAVMSRKWGNNPAVPMKLIPEPSEPVDDLNDYFQFHVNTIKEEFCNTFVEFKNAEFFFTVLPLDI
jgi:hypothetical protein